MAFQSRDKCHAPSLLRESPIFIAPDFGWGLAQLVAPTMPRATPTVEKLKRFSQQSIQIVADSADGEAETFRAMNEKTTSTSPGWKQFAHALKGFCGLLLCLTMAGCVSSEPQTSTVRAAQDKPSGVSDQQVREDIMEAVFRHMCQPAPVEKDLSRPVTRDHKVYFLSTSVWSDPPPSFLKRLNNLGAPVKPIAAAQWSGDFVYDRATGERGAAFSIERVTLRADDEADVDAV